LGRHSDRLSAVRALKTVKGRREQGRFAIEGVTLLQEAVHSGVDLEALYVTDAAYGENAIVRELDERGVPTFTIDGRSSATLSGVETPSGILAVAPTRYLASLEVLASGGLTVVLAGLNDPGNAGTLVRSAEAFGATGVLFGRPGVDPYHPKVVRAAMGSLFRLRIGTARPVDVRAALEASGTPGFGLAAAGTPLAKVSWPVRCALVVGHERHGLGDWSAACSQQIAIPMHGRAESLNAAIAGSIALYEAAKNRS
jgi:TrmH family RNA methyltransferase